MTVEYLDEPYEVIKRPLPWHLQGLQQTASGYGKKLTSDRCVKLLGGQVRRVYITQFGNAGSAWIIYFGRRLYLRG